MIKLSFKILALLTVLGFFTSTALYMAITAVVPAAKVPEKIRGSVYPLAMENTKIRFTTLFENMQQGVIRQNIVFSELEANAFLYEYVGKKNSSAIKEPYLSFLDDTLRFRFDISLADAWKLITNKLKGMDINDSVKKIATTNDPSTRISFTIDIGVEYTDNHPQFSIRRMYIGALPVPFTNFLSKAFTVVNQKSEETFAKLLNTGQFYIREFRMQDKLLVCKFESKVTPELVRKANDARLKKENPGMFTILGRTYDKCRIGCSKEEEDKIKKYFDNIVKKGDLTDKDIETANKTLAEVTRKTGARPNQPQTPQP